MLNTMHFMLKYFQIKLDELFLCHRLEIDFIFRSLVQDSQNGLKWKYSK